MLTNTLSSWLCPCLCMCSCAYEFIWTLIIMISSQWIMTQSCHQQNNNSAMCEIWTAHSDYWNSVRLKEWPDGLLQRVRENQPCINRVNCLAIWLLYVAKKLKHCLLRGTAERTESTTVWAGQSSPPGKFTSCFVLTTDLQRSVATIEMEKCVARMVILRAFDSIMEVKMCVWLHELEVHS